jgi:hypothetical protein
MRVSRRDFLKYTAAGAGALAIPQVAGTSVANASVATASCLWGAFPDPAPYNGDIIKAVTAFESLIGRKLGMTRHYLRWDYSDAGPGGTPTIPSAAMKTFASGGRVPFMDWRCQRMDDSYILWNDIANTTKYDSYITSVAQAFKSWGKKCFVTLNHEPENDAAHMAPGSTLPQAGALYRAAYKKVFGIFTNTVGATNVRWVCTLVQGTYAGTKSDGGTSAWFPNQAKYVGVDGYNRGACSGGWKSFQQLFSPAHDFAKSIGKNMVVEEWGCAPPDACGGTFASDAKATWFTDAGSTIMSWPELKAVIYTHVKAEFRTNVTDFRVNQPGTAELNAYKTVGMKPYFLG